MILWFYINMCVNIILLKKMYVMILEYHFFLFPPLCPLVFFPAGCFVPTMSSFLFPPSLARNPAFSFSFLNVASLLIGSIMVPSRVTTFNKNKNRFICNVTGRLNLQSQTHSKLFQIVIQSKIDHGKHRLNQSILSSLM